MPCQTMDWNIEDLNQRGGGFGMIEPPHARRQSLVANRADLVVREAIAGVLSVKDAATDQVTDGP